eukprot:2231547-Pyramimonas_sp.AAC.1
MSGLGSLELGLRQLGCPGAEGLLLLDLVLGGGGLRGSCCAGGLFLGGGCVNWRALGPLPLLLDAL